MKEEVSIAENIRFDTPFFLTSWNDFIPADDSIVRVSVEKIKNKVD